MTTISAITATGHSILSRLQQDGTRLLSRAREEGNHLMSRLDCNVYDLVVGKVIPVIAAGLAVACVVLSFTVMPLIALGIIPCIGIAILGVFAANKEASPACEVPQFFAPPVPFEPNQPVGLRNSGNNCWANSLIQLAMNTPTLENKLRAYPAFTRIFADYRQSQGAAQRVSGGNSQEIRRYIHEFTEGQVHLGAVQEDAADVLQFLLAEGTPAGPFYSLTQRVTRPTGVSEQRVFQHFIDIGLEVGQTFDVLFKRFFDTTDDRGQHQQRFFDDPPSTLLVQLRRYGQTGWTDRTGATSDFRATKDNNPYPVPLSLILPTPCSLSNQAACYECEGFIEHIGTTPSGGHYVAYVKREGKWWYCSDDTVREASLATVQAAMQRSYIYSFKKV